jgi:hypothetical protein
MSFAVNISELVSEGSLAEVTSVVIADTAKKAEIRPPSAKKRLSKTSSRGGRASRFRDRLTRLAFAWKLLAMPALPDARHERFSQLVADKHMSNAEAYRRAVDKPEMKPDVAASMADKWLNRVDISDRIAELRAHAEAAARLSREQLVDFLSKVISARPCDAAPDNPHCELLAGGKIGFPSKLQAASQLARMCGWDAPQKVNIEATRCPCSCARL